MKNYHSLQIVWLHIQKTQANQWKNCSKQKNSVKYQGKILMDIDK